VGFPIRIFPDQRLLAAPRDLSSPATSFFGTLRQGIHRLPLAAACFSFTFKQQAILAKSAKLKFSSSIVKGLVALL
jgi:hypothetical protein